MILVPVHDRQYASAAEVLYDMEVGIPFVVDQAQREIYGLPDDAGPALVLSRGYRFVTVQFRLIDLRAAEVL